VRLNPRLMLLNTLEQTAALLAQEQGACASEPVIQEKADDNRSLDKPVGFAAKMLQKIGLK